MSQWLTASRFDQVCVRVVDIMFLEVDIQPGIIMNDLAL